MQKHGCGIKTTCSVLLFLGLFAFSACIAAELKRTKVKDVKLAGKFCSLPGSPAFGLGIFAMICLLGVQIIGNMVICKQLCSQDRRSGKEARKQSVGISLLLLSWMSFSFAVIILGAATSMNRKQHYRKGWLDGECYLVKDGLFIGASALLLSTVFFLIGSIWATSTRLRHRGIMAEQGTKVHADDRRSVLNYNTIQHNSIL